VQHRPNRSDSNHCGMESCVGGQCIPIDPHYLSHNVRAKPGYPFRCVELAEEITNADAYVLLQNDVDELALGARTGEALACH
jgi:UDP-N-acetyl-D-mannosaminuronate dehydrogenase